MVAVAPVHGARVSPESQGVCKQNRERRLCFGIESDQAEGPPLPRFPFCGLLPWHSALGHFRSEITSSCLWLTHGCVLSVLWARLRVEFITGACTQEEARVQRARLRCGHPPGSLLCTYKEG